MGRLLHIFHVKKALVSCAFFLRAPYIWQSLRRCSCVSSWRHVEEVHTISSSSFHRTRQMCLQLRAARSFTMRLPLVSALKVVLTSGRCQIRWAWRVPVGFGTESGMDYWKGVHFVQQQLGRAESALSSAGRLISTQWLSFMVASSGSPGTSDGDRKLFFARQEFLVFFGGLHTGVGPGGVMSTGTWLP